MKRSTVHFYVPALSYPSEMPKWMVQEPNYQGDMYNVLKNHAAMETDYLHSVLNGVNGIAKIQESLNKLAPLDPITKISNTEFFEKTFRNNKALVILEIQRQPQKGDDRKAFDWYLEMNKEIWECERIDNSYFALKLRYQRHPRIVVEKEVVFDDVFKRGEQCEEHSDQEHSDKRQKVA